MEQRKTILCYGDSNTWGLNPDTFNFETGAFTRHPYQIRWPGCMASFLGSDCRVIEEGYNGRTTVFEDPIRPGRCALPHFLVSYYSHEPLDLLVLMLGTNDTKDIYAAQPAVIGMGVERLLRELFLILPASLSPKLRTLLISPPEVAPIGDSSKYYPGFSAASREKSKQLPAIYEKLAGRYHCGFLNAAEFVTPSSVDGLHLNEDAHVKLGEVIGTKVKKMLGM
ncbi:MAG: GDSL-type esterase/lipase family protein [Synergistaceae bacterium]|jgi:lysophospholipase L1-like esterase|nr:GDSL-type esterase/lipase family protein [Synergistaceae bacterium]